MKYSDRVEIANSIFKTVTTDIPTSLSSEIGEQRDWLCKKLDEWLVQVREAEKE